MNSFYFCCFYVGLQPYVVFPTLLGFFLQYWSDKYRLLYNSKRPVPSSELLADAMGQLILFSPFVLTLGNITWYQLVPDDSIEMTTGIKIAQFVAIGVSALFFLLPLDSILDAICAIPDDERLIYEECLHHLRSDYDRKNPATKA